MKWYGIDIFVSIALALTYWFISTRKKEHFKFHKIKLASIKWLSVVLLFEWERTFLHLWMDGIKEKGIAMALKHGTILFYSIGDVIIIWNEPLSIYFFLTGHICFLTRCIWLDLPEKFVPILIRVGHYGGLWILSIVGTVIAYKQLAKKSEADGKSFKSSEQITYFLYIHILFLLIFIPIYHSYFGMLLFVLSDLAIGFDLPLLHSYSFLLYYGSLLYLNFVTAAY